jgi:hypothetical protein|eukprot:COSAG01_NODE_940_length_12584_cov_7.454218_9_plen_73_part_00
MERERLEQFVAVHRRRQRARRRAPVVLGAGPTAAAAPEVVEVQAEPEQRLLLRQHRREGTAAPRPDAVVADV